MSDFYELDPREEFELITELITTPWCRWCQNPLMPIFVKANDSGVGVVERCSHCDGYIPHLDGPWPWEPA